MEDDFLGVLREPPCPAFTRTLRAELQALDATAARRRAARRRLRAAALSVCVLLMAGSLVFPAVRATARQILDLFRDRSMVDVRFDPARLAEAREMLAGRSPALLMFEERTLVRDPGAPATFPTLAAAAAGGRSFAAPVSLPSGVDVERVEITGAGRARFRMDREKLRVTIDRLDLQEVRVPRRLAEASFEVPLPPAVAVYYRSPTGHAVYIQRERPEPALPRGLDLPLLGEIGLRVAGVEAHQAHALAESIDWTSSFLVPFPRGAASFRTIAVSGHPALLASGQPSGSGIAHAEHTVMWSEGGRLHSLAGDLPLSDLLKLAGSVR